MTLDKIEIYEFFFNELLESILIDEILLDYGVFL